MCSSRIANQNIILKRARKQLTFQKRKKRKARYPEIWILALGLPQTGHVTLASHLNLSRAQVSRLFL